MLIHLKSVDSTDYNPEKVMNYNYFALQQIACEISEADHSFIQNYAKRGE